MRNNWLISLLAAGVLLAGASGVSAHGGIDDGDDGEEGEGGGAVQGGTPLEELYRRVLPGSNGLSGLGCRRHLLWNSTHVVSPFLVGRAPYALARHVACGVRLGVLGKGAGRHWEGAGQRMLGLLGDGRGGQRSPET